MSVGRTLSLIMCSPPEGSVEGRGRGEDSSAKGLVGAAAGLAQQDGTDVRRTDVELDHGKHSPPWHPVRS
jgi:hypothetical protein